MKILFDFELNEQDFKELEWNFNSIEHYEFTGSEYNNVIIDSKELAIQEFDDYIQNWIDIWMSIVWDKDRKHYILTDIAI